jgi:RNA polymerase sigma-70 factor (ECF subfamily)
MSQRKLSDGELVHWIRNPETRQAGFSHLVHTYQNVLYKTIVRLVISKEDAEDLVQETFVKIYRNIHQLSDAGKLRYWLLKMANNEALMFLRKARIRAHIRFEHHDRVLTEALHQNNALSENEILLSFHKSLLTLAPKQRAIFHLRYFDEMPFEDVAHIMGNSASSCKAAYHQSVKKIERFLKDEE